MKPIGFIYLTTNLVNGMIYVGKHESEIMKGRFSGNKNPMWGKKRSKNKKYVTKSF